MFLSRVCVTPSCCWKSLQVWFKWNTVTRCCWCPHSKDHCFTALKKRRSSSWAPNLARGKCLPITECQAWSVVSSNTCSPSLFIEVKTELETLWLRKPLVVFWPACFVAIECLSVFYSLWNYMLISIVLSWCVQQWQVWSMLPARSLQTEWSRGVCCPTWSSIVEI